MNITKDLLQWNAEQVLLGHKTNTLLARDAVGKAKPSTRILPKEDFSFGKPELFEDRDTVAKGIYFQFHKRSLYVQLLRLGNFTKTQS